MQSDITQQHDDDSDKQDSEVQKSRKNQKTKKPTKRDFFKQTHSNPRSAHLHQTSSSKKLDLWNSSELCSE